MAFIKILAMRLVVVVFPCEPATAMLWNPRIRLDNISALAMIVLFKDLAQRISGLDSVTAVE